MGGSIHCNENIAYSMKEMGAGIEVIKILKEGYSLPFTRLPGQYREKNNHSAKKHGTKVIPPLDFSLPNRKGIIQMDRKQSQVKHTSKAVVAIA